MESGAVSFFSPYLSFANLYLNTGRPTKPGSSAKKLSTPPNEAPGTTLLGPHPHAAACTMSPRLLNDRTPQQKLGAKNLLPQAVGLSAGKLQRNIDLRQKLHYSKPQPRERMW